MTSFQLQNPYYSNPFFRPRIVQNSSQTTINGNGSITTINRDPSTTNMTTIAVAPQNSSTLTRTLPSSKTQSSLILSPQRAANSDVTIITAVNQDESRNWAHTVARRFPADQIQKPTINLSTSNVKLNEISSSKRKETFFIRFGRPDQQWNRFRRFQAESFVDDRHRSFSDGSFREREKRQKVQQWKFLLDFQRLQTNNGSSTSANVLTRPILTRDDGNLSTNNAAQQETNVSQSTTNSSLPTSHHQDWRKNLTVRYQQNTKNIATAKIFQSKQTTTTVLNGETILPQPIKTERILGINSNQNERTFQASDTTPAISLLIRKSTDIVRPAKQENNNVERSVSLQVERGEKGQNGTKFSIVFLLLEDSTVAVVKCAYFRNNSLIKAESNGWKSSGN